MKKITILLAVLSIFACKNREKRATETQKSEQQATASKHEPVEKEITVAVRRINPYCGGAAPSDEMERMRMKGEPGNNIVFYITNGNGVSIRFKTSEMGTAKASLKPGSYCIKEGYKIDPEMKKVLANSDWEIDEECIAKWNASCNHEFEVTDSTTVVSFTYYGRCGYEGPVPCITNAGFPPP